MSREQTAVQYTEELIKIILYNIDSDELERIQEVFDEAIQMEKQQIINSFKEGTKFIDINDEISAEFNGIIYYNETFKKLRYE